MCVWSACTPVRVFACKWYGACVGVSEIHYVFPLLPRKVSGAAIRGNVSLGKEGKTIYEATLLIAFMSRHGQDEVDDLIHDEVEELPDERDLARVYRRVEADQRARDADMSPEELEEYVKRRFERPGFDADHMGEQQAGMLALPPRLMPTILPSRHPIPSLGSAVVNLGGVSAPQRVLASIKVCKEAGRYCAWS